MRVRAAPDHAVPMEHAPRTHIGAKPVNVPDTLYYRRRLARGELRRVDDAQGAPAAPSPPSPPTPPTSATRHKGSKA